MSRGNLNPRYVVRWVHGWPEIVPSTTGTLTLREASESITEEIKRKSKEYENG